MKKSICLAAYICFLIVPAPVFAQEISTDASATGISRAFNPAISVNGLFWGMGSSEDDPLWPELGLVPGLHLQEMSLEVTSNVDIYFKAQAALSATETTGLEVEEFYLTTLQMPIPLTIRGGKMLNHFGQHNLLHLHHMAFAEPPMIHAQVFGPDLNELGMEASYLVPAPWYMDLTLGVLNGDNRFLFAGEEQDDYAYLVHLDNLWDLNDEITLRLGSSYLTGEKGLHYPDPARTPVAATIDEIVSEVWGADLQLKWRPLEHGRYRSFTLQGEYAAARLAIDRENSRPLSGAFVQALVQFQLRWWLQARYDWFARPASLHDFFPEPVTLTYNRGQDLYGDRYSLALAYVPTEFSAFRVQYNALRLGDNFEYQVIFQTSITIGSHPAHKY